MSLPFAGLTGVIRPFYLAWIDFGGDPVRVTTLERGYTFAAGQTGDADLDGQTFVHAPVELIEFGDVIHGRGGSDQVTATLSGLPGPNDALLTALSTRASWAGRTARLWTCLRDPVGNPTDIDAHYTGYLVELSHSGDPDAGTMTVVATIENYRALLAAPRGRTYQDQGLYDAGDLSAARIRSSANGTTAAAITGGGGGGGGSSALERINYAQL